MNPNESVSRQLQISNDGDGNLEWKVSSNEKWITLDPDSGTNSGTLDITVNTENLDPGEYEGKITINSKGGNKQFPVKLVVRDLPELPILALSPDPHSLSFDLNKGKSDTKELQIKNEGGGTLNWNVSEDENWIKLSQESGADTGTVTVTVDTDDLDPGKEYDGTITITSNDGSQECTVHLNVLSNGNNIEPPELAVNPEPSFELKLIKGESESKEFIISNAGEGTLEWNISADKEWIILSPENGTNSETVTVKVDTENLDPGEYEGKITINSNDGSKECTIHLNVLPLDEDPKLKVDPEPSFELKLIKGESESKEFIISNGGNGTLEWNVSADKEWIILSPENGTNSETVTVKIDTENMGQGTYEGNIKVYSNGGDKAIPVTLVITPVEEITPVEKVEVTEVAE